MGFNEEYLKLRKKRLKEEENGQPREILTPYRRTLASDAPTAVMKEDGASGDIAPVTFDDYAKENKSNNTVTEGNKTEERTWFKKSGLWDDGYQFGDVTKTILAGGQDLWKHAVEGAAKIGEGTVDALLTIAPYVAQGQYYANGGGYNLQADAIANEMFEAGKKGNAEIIKKDIVDEEAVAKFLVEDHHPLSYKYLTGGRSIDADSVFGEKSDALAQSGGQLAATAGLQALGVPWWLTTGATTLGGESENALNQGATLEEAAVSGMISAGAEILTEKISGGISFGGKTLDDALTKELARGISNKAVRTLAKLGIDAVGEGNEELLSGVMSAIGQKLTYADDKEISELFSSEEAFESFIGGVVLGGGSSAISAGKAVISGKDAVTGLKADTEQKVVDKLYKEAITEAETDGKKLTLKDKQKLYDGVLNNLEKGYISTDVIEEVLGGEDYKTYQSEIKRQQDLDNELNELRNMKSSEMTDIQTERMAELKAMKPNTEMVNALKFGIDEKIRNSIKDTKLVESYNEKARRGEAFKADLSGYDSKQAAVVQKAIDSGILNNTNRTHEFVDMVSKISADKGVLFDFSNNDKLKESGFALEGKTINGFVTKDGVTLNIDSQKSLNSVVGHEIAHVLEGTELYTELSKAITEYAKGKGDYQGRYDSLSALYKGIEGANIDAELTADLVGDYLFTDADFVNNLSVQHRNVFEKIFDEIKYLYKVATAGSKEARELEKVKKVFEQAYKASGKAQAGTKYSMSDNTGKALTKEQSDYFKDSKMRDDNGNLKVMYHGSQDAGFHVFDPSMSDDGTSLFFVDSNDVAASYSGTSETYEAQTIKTAEDMNAFIESIGAEGYEVAENNGKFTLLYEGERVADSNTAKGIYKEFCWYEGVGEGDANYKVYLNLTNPLVVDAKGKNWNNVSREYSQEVADRYNSLTAEEKAALASLAEWGEYSIFRDEMLEARATAEQGGYGMFDEEFTKNLARAYEKLGGANTNLYDAFSIASDNFSAESIKEFAVKQMNTRDYAKKAKAEGYDGVIFNNIVDVGGYSNGSEGPSTVAIAFNSEQVKSVANEKPTKDPDIRYSISSKDIENFDNLRYNEIKLPAAEQERIQSEALTWHPNERNKLITQTISQNNYDITYNYVIDDDGIVHVYGRETADNIHERRNEYDIANREKSDSITEELWAGQRNNSRDINFSQDGRKPRNDDTNNNRIVSGERRSNGTGYPKDRANAYGKPKRRAWHFNDDGSYDVTYSDGTKENIAPIKEASSSDGVFFDGKNPKYSLSEYTAEEKKAHNDAVKNHFGRTYKWAETGYLLLDGTRLDMSGKHDGAPGGYRTVDHRDITEALGYDYGGGDYSGALIQFMSEGNIRIIPEIDGINLSVKPTKAQEQALSEYIFRNRGEVVLDIDDLNGYTVVSVEYPSGTRSAKILNDIREWFDNGIKPENSSGYSLTKEGDTPKRYGSYNVYGKDIGLDRGNIAPMQEDISDVENTTEGIAPAVDKAVDKTVDETYPDGFAPMEHSAMYESEVKDNQAEMDRLAEEASRLYSEGKADEAQAIIEQMQALNESGRNARDRYNALRTQERADTEGYLNSLTDADAPPEIEAPYYEDGGIIDPFDERDVKTVGDRKVKSFMAENPEVKPYFQAEANILLGELNNSIKGERFYTATPDGHLDKDGGMTYGSDSYGVWSGTSRSVTPDIAQLLDNAKGDGKGYSYDEIRTGLEAIIKGDANNACSKRIEFVINDRLMNGYITDGGVEVPANQEYRDLIKSQGVLEGREEAFKQLIKDTNKSESAEDIAPIAPTFTTSRKDQVTGQQRWAESIRPKGEKAETAEPRMKRADNPSNVPHGMEERRWVGTSTSSEAVDGMVTPDDIPDEVRYYKVKPNKKTLEAANARLARDGYAKSREYFEGKMYDKKLTVEDIALGERLIQEAAKAGDAKAVQDLIIDVSIIGTELGQRVQALSIIQRLTPEGQLKALHRMVERGKTRGDKAYSNVDITDDITDSILKTYKEDGTFDKADLDRAVEEAKQKLADQMEVTTGEKLNAWRYLAMLGNPKTHIRNLVSNVAMMGTRAVKNTIARTIEDIAPIKTRTKTWARATDDVKKFAQQTTAEMDSAIKGDTKYSEESSIKAKRQMFKTKPLNAVNKFNQNALEWEDAIFSKPVFRQTLQEYLTANGIKTEADILNNPEIVTKAREYALEEARRATFRQDSYLANKISEVEKKNGAFGIAIGSIMPFKKTPINIAKTGLSYSPLGFARNIYDAVQVKKGNMDASEAIDHLAQTLTGTSLTLIGYALASAGMLNGAGEDDKEGKYDYQLGEQSYSFNFGGDTYSLSWLSPVAMPLLVGANAYEKLVEKEEWDANVVIDTLAQTLDPLSEMSFLSSLDDVLSSYDSGIEKFMGAGESMVQNYATQFVPTLSSQVAATFDDTKRSTAAARDSSFKFGEETVNKIKYKIPGLRNTLAPTTDIWGNEMKQTENIVARGFESFFSPANKRAGIATAVDEELNSLYGETDDSGVLPSIPQSYINYDGERYDMSTEEYTEYKKLYGQTAYDLMEKLFNTNTYKNASSEERADMVNRVYDYARDNAKREYFAGIDLDFTNATKEGKEYYKENSIVGAIAADLPVDEYEFSTEYPEKYKFFKDNDLYQSYKNADEDGKRAYNWAFDNPGKYTMSKVFSDDLLTFYGYRSEANDIKGVDEDGDGRTDSGTKKTNVINWLNGRNDLDYGQKIILYRSMYNSKQDREDYNMDIIDYLNSRNDINYAQMKAILEELGMTVDSEGYIYWD